MEYQTTEYCGCNAVNCCRNISQTCPHVATTRDPEDGTPLCAGCLAHTSDDDEG